MFKTWDEMTDAEKAKINEQEDARESYKNAMSGWEPEPSEPSEDDLAEFFARMEERADGIHKDSLYF